MFIHCPDCLCCRVRPESPRWYELPLLLVLLQPYRCRRCARRFLGWREPDLRLPLLPPPPRSPARSRHTFSARAALIVAAALAGLAVGRTPASDDFEREPIRYSSAPARNAVTRLQQRLDGGTARLVHEERFGYLR